MTGFYALPILYIMDETIHQLILRAVNLVFGKMQIHIDGIESTTNDDNYQVIITVGVLGDLKGCLMLRSNLQTAKEVVSKLFFASQMTNDEQEFGSMHKAALGELLNQITAEATLLLYKNNYNCNITPPTILSGKEIKSATMDLTYSYSSNILCESGIINLYFSLKE